MQERNRVHRVLPSYPSASRSDSGENNKQDQAPVALLPKFPWHVMLSRGSYLRLESFGVSYNSFSQCLPSALRCLILSDCKNDDGKCFLAEGKTSEML